MGSPKTAPVNKSLFACLTCSVAGPQHLLCPWSEWHWGTISWIGGRLSLSLLCVKKRTPVASSPDWPSRVPVARQPSSGAWALADRQLLMKLGRRVEGACYRKGLSDLFSYASHVLGSCYTQVYGCSSTPLHTPAHSHRHLIPCCVWSVLPQGPESASWMQSCLRHPPPLTPSPSPSSPSD